MHSLSPTPTSPGYTLAQRLVALAYGMVCHLAFALAVIAMAFALFTGLRHGLGPFHGWTTILANAMLIAMFPLAHSWLLSPRGRRFMARLVPLGIGPKLSWTVFATLSSLQLLAVFLLWSPSGTVWWEASGGLCWAIGGAAACSWLLLGKSMADAQLGVQTGYIGWSSVFLNRKAVYKPFATQGLYRHVRQPIYISFSLLLWLTTAWTPDQLVLAVLWTGYCVVGAALKERRFIRCFGEAFRTYQAQVPFWFPSLRKERLPQESVGQPCDADAIIIGAGPVGLLLANLLGARGKRVLLVERRTKPFSGSMAIGITPPSLSILKTLGLDHEFVRRGVPITTARVFEKNKFLGKVDFSRIAAEHRCILSLPQSETIALLKENLAKYPTVRLVEGMEFIEYRQRGGHVNVCLRDTASEALVEYRAPWLVGCDGHRSQVRTHAGIRFPGHHYRPRFLMADFDDRTALGAEAHLYFGPKGSVESFPLSNGQRRWIVQLPGKQKDLATELGETVAKHVGLRTSFDLSHQPPLFESAFHPQRRLARTYVKGNVLLCGDAAHVMSPIGGQGMNTGFADAAHLANALQISLEAPNQSSKALAIYNRKRRHAFRVAATRAATGMWLGTRTGRILSLLRHLAIQRILFRPSIREGIAPYFAMLTIPHNPQPETVSP